MDQGWPDKSQGDQVSVPSRGFVSWEKMTWKKARVTGSGFLAGAFVYWESMTSEKARVIG